MIKKVVVKRSLQDPHLIQSDLEYWLRRPPEERVAAVDYLRRQLYGSATRLQRTARVIERAQG
jgi:hypothetical protein